MTLVKANINNEEEHKVSFMKQISSDRPERDVTGEKRRK